MKHYLFCFLLVLMQIAFGSDKNVGNYSGNPDPINAAITDCANSGGGTVTVPSGTYTTKSIHMKSNVALLLQGATIQGTSGIDAAEPNSFSQFQDYGHSHFHDALIWGENLNNIKIIGHGTINGNGALVTGNPSTNQGDKAISLKLCTNVEIGGLGSSSSQRLTMEKYGHFAMLLTGCSSMNVHDIYAPAAGTQRDFMDIMQCSNVTITNITVDNESDDVIKLGSDFSLGQILASTGVHASYITAKTNCNVCMIGSETVGDISDVSFKHITVLGTGKAAVGIMSNDGSAVSNIVVDSVTTNGTTSPFWIKITNRGRCPNPKLGSISNVSISNMSVTNCVSGEYTATVAGYQNGSDLAKIRNVTFNNVSINAYGGHPASDTSKVPTELLPTSNPNNAPYNLKDYGTRPSYGFYLRHVDGITFNNLQLSYAHTDGRSAIVARDANNTQFNSLTAERGSGRKCDVEFLDASTYSISNSPGIVVFGGSTQSSGGTPEYIWQEAEAGVISSPMAIQSDALASGGQFVAAPTTSKATTPPASGYSVISFTALGGDYTLWGRTIAPNTSTNSFFVRIDNGSWFTWSDNTAVSTAWKWNNFTTFTNISAGSHTLTVAYREGGTELDKILLTTDGSFTPTGTGGVVAAVSSLSKQAIGVSEINVQSESTLPSKYALLSNYPNPFNPSTIISYNLQAAGQVRIAIYDISGREIMTLIDGYQNAGIHQITWDASSVRGRQLASGMYLARMTAGTFTQTIKLLLMK